jgi:hypothetical protein
MRYMMLIFSDQSTGREMSQSERDEMMSSHMAFAREMRERGVMKGGDELHPASIATTIRVRDGETLTCDGPFVETKEQIGGYYILDCRDLDEAIECAAKIPTAARGAIEIRPIVDFN